MVTIAQIEDVLAAHFEQFERCVAKGDMAGAAEAKEYMAANTRWLAKLYAAADAKAKRTAQK